MQKGRFQRLVAEARKGAARLRSVHLIAAALMLHLTLALVIHFAGRFALFPDLVDSNGTGLPLALDAIRYRQDAISLVEILKHEGILAWSGAPYHLHTKLYSLSFAIFGPLFGFNSLSAEPINALLYLLTLVLVFRLGRETFDRRVGLIAATLVALWPTFIMHTTQLLRDPLFIAAMLVLVLVCVSWLTRIYSWHVGLAMGALGGIASAILWLNRFNLWPLVQVIVVVGAVLFLFRQFRERRLLAGNLIGVALLFVMMLSIPQVVGALQMPDYVLPAPVQTKVSTPPAVNAPPVNASEWLTKQRPLWQRLPETIQFLRDAYSDRYGSNLASIDVDVRFKTTGDIVRYLPRAAVIGFFAPFPEMWFARGAFVGLTGRILSGLETFSMYLMELMAIVGFWRGRSRRKLPAWMILLIAAMGVVVLSLVVINVGALYRMRYVFWILIIVLGAEGIGQAASLFLAPGRLRRA